jgi:Cd2+/Zn2+-exporting ATPase
MAITKKEYSLIGLGCANCAAKMEKGINKLSYIKEATIAFATKTLIIEAENQEEEKLTKDIEDIVHTFEHRLLSERRIDYSSWQN